MANEDIDVKTTLAIISARLDDIKQDIVELRDDQRIANRQSVSRNEWEQRNNYSDSKFSSLGREIGDLRTEINSKRAPWWTWVTVLLAGASFIYTFVVPV